MQQIITQESKELVEFISNNMESHTFHHHYHILYDLRTFLGKDPINYVEIGCFAGGSACLMTSHPYPTNCLSIDIGSPIPPEIAKANVAKYKKEHNTWEYFKGSSRNLSTINIVKNKFPVIDLLFIDGDHSYQAVIDDFYNYKDLVPVGGYIIFDDYLDFKHSPEVKPAVDHIVKELAPNYEIIGTLKNEFKAKPASKELSNEFIIKVKY